MELKRCPFCGKTVTRMSGNSVADDSHAIACFNSSCVVQPRTNTFILHKQALQAWNTREPVLSVEEIENVIKIGGFKNLLNQERKDLAQAIHKALKEGTT